MPSQSWIQSTLVLTSCVFLGCAADGGGVDTTETAPGVYALERLRCSLEAPESGPVAAPYYFCRATLSPEPGDGLKELHEDCGHGLQAYIGNLNYQTSFNVKSSRKWQDAVCDYGALSGSIACADTPDPGWLGGPPDENVFSDGADIAIEPGDYSPTSVQVACPPHLPYMVEAHLVFQWMGYVPVVQD